MIVGIPRSTLGDSEGIVCYLFYLTILLREAQRTMAAALLLSKQHRYHFYNYTQFLSQAEFPLDLLHPNSAREKKSNQQCTRCFYLGAGVVRFTSGLIHCPV